MKSTCRASSRDKLVSSVKFRIPTGCDGLDTVLGGGLPSGRVFELYGDFSDGKTTLSESIIVQCQHLGGVSLLLLTEPTVDLDRLSLQGCDLDSLLISEPSCLEDGFDEIISFLKTKDASKELRGVPGLIVWDTLPSAPLRTEIEGKKWGEGMMAKPRLIRKGLSILAHPLAKHHTSLLALSQTIASPTPYTPVSTSGGGGLKFWSSLRLHIKRRRRCDDIDGKPDGILSSVKISKSKVHDCLVARDAFVYIGHTRGIDNDLSSYYQLEGAAYKYNRGWVYLTIGGEELATFRWRDFKKTLDADESLRKRIKEEVVRVLSLAEPSGVE